MRILFMPFEKFSLFYKLLFDGEWRFQGSKIDASMSKKKLISQSVIVFEKVNALIYQIDLSDDSNGSYSFAVYLPR